MIADLDIGILFILAVLSLAVYGVVIGGWASNNKYSFLGGLRATANMISYEIPLGLSALAVLLMFGTLNLNEIVDKQAHYWAGFIPAWNVFIHPLAFLMFLVCIHAEANRAPFDTAEAEQELVGGYHTEYSSMRFALFFLAEYAGMITTSAVCVALFFGGWHLPGLGGHVDALNPSVTDSLLLCIVRSLVFFGKTLVIIAVFMWVRWSLPRFRFDQIMNLAWRALIPISLILVLATAVTIWALGPQERGPRMLVTGWMAFWLFLVNIGVLAAVMFGSKLIPAAPDTNRKMRIPGSRFNVTPLPARTPAAATA
jgi:NADH-quinone oxidoreductase subunit H